ncbi:arginase family protein [Halorientalis pallida]|uniref:Agmatinase n=1 Tax=Halorientalis pallida TaxID=2479928 RepID=A0A498L7H9_9EURY|nr:arginase family protein [Halorientalis pallida]RXK51695.1 agmatinase [Halorientalis pallida]
MFPGARAHRDSTAGTRSGEPPVADAPGDTTGTDSSEPPVADAPGDPAYVVVGAPLDASTTFQPGTRFGPRRVRHFAESFDDYDHRTDQQFTGLDVADHGDIGPTDDVSEYLDFLRGTLEDVRDDGAVPVTIGGEHTVTVAGVRAVDPDVCVCLDAHLDLRESYANNPLSHATVTHHALSVADEAIVLGARTGSETEWDRASEDDVTVVPPGEVADWDPPDVVREGRTYLSVDIDAADPGFAPGTGTLEPFGLEPREMHEVVRAVAPHAAGFDVVEVNDRDDGQAATLAAKLLRAFVFAHAAGE